MGRVMICILLHLKNLTHSGMLAIYIWASRKGVLYCCCVSGIDIRYILVDWEKRGQVKPKLRWGPVRPLLEWVKMDQAKG